MTDQLLHSKIKQIPHIHAVYHASALGVVVPIRVLDSTSIDTAVPTTLGEGGGRAAAERLGDCVLSGDKAGAGLPHSKAHLVP